MKKLLNIFLLLLITAVLSGQVTDIRIPKGVKKIDLPFEYVNDFMVVNLVFNNLLPLKFIFDTGAEHTIITKKEITDLLQVNYQKEITLYGSDLKTKLTAYLATGVSFDINNYDAINRTALVLEQDYFNFEEMTGYNIQGIIGSDIFRRFVVEIDYRRRKITLHDPEHFAPPRNKSYKEIDIDIHRHKPYVNARAIFQNKNQLDAKLLLDTGASLPLLLYTNSDSSISIPPKVIKSTIAIGLGGALEGYLGRIDELDISGYQINNIITSFQDLGEDFEMDKIFNRHGILGNKLLKRFTFYLDYTKGKGYFKATRRLNKKFKFDRSGINVIASGRDLRTFIVSDIIPGSPADEVDIRPGDEIRRINGVPYIFLTLEGINRRLKKKVGKVTRLVIIRDGTTLKKKFKLRNLI